MLRRIKSCVRWALFPTKRIRASVGPNLMSVHFLKKWGDTESFTHEWVNHYKITHTIYTHMSMLKNTKNDNKYVSILADATMRLPVTEDTEGAVKRDYETSDGNTGTKWELVFTELSGKIDKIAFFDGEYAKLLQLTFTNPEDEDEEPLILSVSTGSTFGEDIMKKLLSIDMEKPVRLVPYSFDDEKTKKTKKGVTIYQDGDTKVKNFFYDEETKKVCNGYPEVPAGHGKKAVSKDEWKIYFAQARLFMINTIIEKFGLEQEDPALTEWDKDAQPEAPKLEPAEVEPKGMDLPPTKPVAKKKGHF